MGPTINLISRTHHSYERRKYAFMVFRKYTIISPNFLSIIPHLTIANFPILHLPLLILLLTTPPPPPQKKRVNTLSISLFFFLFFFFLFLGGFCYCFCHLYYHFFILTCSCTFSWYVLVFDSPSHVISLLWLWFEFSLG